MRRAALSVTVLFFAVSAAAEPKVAVSLRGECRRPLPARKTFTPCAAASALNLVGEAGFLSASRTYDAKTKAEAPASPAAACLDDNGIEYLHERQDLLKDIGRIRDWAKAAADVEADVEDASCVESVGGYMIGGTKSDHPERMASNVAMSVWALTHHNAEARKRRGKKELSDEEKKAAEREAKEFSSQREFLLDQLEALQAWADKAAAPETTVAVKDPPLERYDDETLAKTEKLLLEMQERLKRIDERMKKTRKLLEEMPKARRALMRSPAPAPLKPLKSESNK